MNIIGIAGRLGSGKDTVADVFIDRYGFQKVALSDPMKRFVRRVFGFSDAQLWGPSGLRNGVDRRYGKYVPGAGEADSQGWGTAEANLRAWGPDWVKHLAVVSDLNEIHEGGVGSNCSVEARGKEAYHSLVDWFHWLATHYENNLSPRVALQSLGTEWGRAKVHEDVWINYAIVEAERRIIEEGIVGVVISDIRFKNELKVIKAAGGKLVRIQRPDTDDLSHKTGMKDHVSEAVKFRDDEFDFLINNDGTLNDLVDTVHVYASCLGLVERD